MWAALHKRKLSSSQIILFGFAGVILVGTLLLLLPFATQNGQSASFWDALFTSTSAVFVQNVCIDLSDHVRLCVARIALRCFDVAFV